MKYQAGDLIYYEDDDPIFDTREEAEAYVEKHFQFLDRPGAVWTDQDDGSELLAIYYGGEWFTK
jgi:hypothetical protein